MLVFEYGGSLINFVIDPRQSYSIDCIPRNDSFLAGLLPLVAYYPKVGALPGRASRQNWLIHKV